MKKAIAILLSLTMILGLAACGNSASQTEQPSTEDTSVESKADTESAENGTDMENTDNQDVQNHKALVAYFSATGTTKGVAEHIANGLNADIYEIVPEEPYTDADLDYNDNNSRTTIEMNDPDARPAISGSVENMEQYDIVFIGYLSGGMLPQRLLILFWRVMISQVKPSFLLLLLAAAAWETQMKNLHRVVLALS